MLNILLIIISLTKRLKNLEKIQVSNDGAVLTRPEILCLYFLLQGKTAKATAKILDISNRTVEDHLFNAKRKLKPDPEVKLFSAVLNSPFLNQIITFGKTCYPDIQLLDKNAIID